MARCQRSGRCMHLACVVVAVLLAAQARAEANAAEGNYRGARRLQGGSVALPFTLAPIITGNGCALAKDGAPCDTDNNKCTQEWCKKGKCVIQLYKACASPAGNAPAEVSTGFSQCNARKDTAYCDPADGLCKVKTTYTPQPNTTKCDGDYNRCTIDLCTGSGQCKTSQVVRCPMYSPPAPSKDTQCRKYTGYYTCNPLLGKCVLNEIIANLQDGATCDLDGNKCTMDVCQKGKCVAGVKKLCPVLSAPAPTWTSQCLQYTYSNTCEPKTGSCVPATKVAKKADGTHCPLAAPGDRCRDAVCRNGLCANITVTTCPPYKPPAVTRDNQCKAFTGTTLCDALRGCVVRETAANKAEGASCDLDNNMCTPDVCERGTCVRRAPIVCPKPTLAPGYDAMCYKVAGGDKCNPKTGMCDLGLLLPSTAGSSCEKDGKACTIDRCAPASTLPGARLTCQTIKNTC